MIYPWLNIICAMTKYDQVIGLYNQLPWPKLKQDMKRFKHLTLNSPVIMGNNTFKSLNNTPLADRENIILTRCAVRIPSNEDIIFLGSVQDCLDHVCIKSIDPNSDGRVWVIGGSQVYQTFLPYVNKLYLTIIDKNFYGDKHFPYVNFNEWRIESIEKVEGEEIPYQFEIWSRK